MLLRLVPIFRQRCIIIYYCIGILLYIIAQLHSHVIFFQMERYSTASHADYHPFNVYDNDGVHLLRVHTLRQWYMDRGMLHCLYTLIQWYGTSDMLHFMYKCALHKGYMGGIQVCNIYSMQTVCVHTPFQGYMEIGNTILPSMYILNAKDPWIHVFFRVKYYMADTASFPDQLPQVVCPGIVHW